MNRNDSRFIAQKLRAEYTEKQVTELDALRKLDKRVRRPANIFAYVFGSVGALVAGSGMSLIMTEAGAAFGMTGVTAPAVIIGVIGLAMAAFNYPLYRRILNIRKEKYRSEIFKLSDEIINKDI